MICWLGICVFGFNVLCCASSLQAAAVVTNFFFTTQGGIFLEAKKGPQHLQQPQHCLSYQTKGGHAQQQRK
jgi:hypothetical protein